MEDARDKDLDVIEWEMIDYDKAFDIQKRMVQERMEDNGPDRLLLLSHFPVVTLGKSSRFEDLTLPEKVLNGKGIVVSQSDRGGRATFHGPGQMVAYPIIKLDGRDVMDFVHALLKAIGAVLEDFGMIPQYREDAPGVWVNGAKIASIGIALKKRVTYHGIALNVNPDLSSFDLFVPCGVPGQVFTSMERETGQTIPQKLVRRRFEHHFRRFLGYDLVAGRGKPDWLKRPVPKSGSLDHVNTLIRSSGLETVCEQAHCPNLGECFNQGTATFMILGKHCTRSCRFCAVETGPLDPPASDEPERVAQAVEQLGLSYAVITSVTRDDLDDGGADQFVRVIKAVRARCPETKIEVLVPDFKGDEQIVRRVCRERPSVFNHNIETVPRLYSRVRPRADYLRSLFVLNYASSEQLIVKSGLMLGLGESDDEIKRVLEDLLKVGCSALTLGQYLSPSKAHTPVYRYLSPDEFEFWSFYGKSAGFNHVASGPFVRSSYHAESVYSSNVEPFKDCRNASVKTAAQI